MKREAQREIKVSIHAPARGATMLTIESLALELFQSTRPQGARRQIEFDCGHLPSVSIHAPARGATTGQRRGNIAGDVSIHAPARGATAFDLVKNEKAQGKNIIALRPQSIYLEK